MTDDLDRARYAVTAPTRAATFGHEFLVGESLLDSIRKIQDQVDLFDRVRHMAEMRFRRVEHMLSVLPEGWGVAVGPMVADPAPHQNRVTFQAMPIPPEGEPSPIPAGWEIFRSKKAGPFEF